MQKCIITCRGCRSMPKGALKWMLAPFLIAVFTFITFLILFYQILLFLGIFALALWILTLIFFRDPERDIGRGVVSPADGLIRAVQTKKDRHRVSIFMNIHNVHVNRSPFGGRVIKMRHKPGSHIPAFKKESKRNERMITCISTDLGEMRVIQIAGTVARRIVPYVEEGCTLRKGERIGLICFGSRVDLIIPSSLRLACRKGQKVFAGSTTLAFQGAEAGAKAGD